MRAGRGQQRGFTLLEIIVVMALLSLVMLGLGASLRSFASTEARVDARLEQAHEFRAVVRFVQSVAGRVSSDKRTRDVAAGASPYWFVGEPQSMAWIGIMPARFGAGGRYFFRLAAEPVEQGQALVLRFAPWTPEAAFPDWAQAESRLLVPELVSAQFRYLDARSPELAWLDAWAPIDHLPAKLSLALEDGRSEWPEVVVSLRDLALSRGGTGGFVSGGGRQ